MQDIDSKEKQRKACASGIESGRSFLDLGEDNSRKLGREVDSNSAYSRGKQESVYEHSVAAVQPAWCSG